MHRIVLVLVATLFVGVQPAQSVVGGTPIEAADTPWFVPLRGCGSTLIAPDRLLTAAHCVEGRSLDRIVGSGAGGARAVAFATPPTWRVRNGGNNRDDVAIIQLDRPVPGGQAVELATSAPQESLFVVGGGLVTPPSSVAAGDGGGWRPGLRQVAPLRPVSDDACAAAYRTARGNEGEAFVPRVMLCATDVDGLAPLSSACNGDSGGPLYAERPGATPLVFGVVSWGGVACGADLLPNVFADVAAFRAFALSRAPVWAPAPTRPATITGMRRPGRLLRCTAAGATGRATRTDVTWSRSGSSSVRRGATYRVRETDRGKLITCDIQLSGPGGMAAAPYARASKVRIPRA